MIAFDEATHTYRLDGVVVPSVTQIIAPLTANALARIPRDVLERKRRIGIAVHLATELDDQGVLDESTVDDAVAGYLAAWRRYRAECRPQWRHIEMIACSRRRRYAGRIDRIGIIDDDLWTVDVKTAIIFDAAIGVQLAGYSMLVAEELKLPHPAGRRAVRLSPDGAYTQLEYRSPDDFSCFAGLLAARTWQDKHQRKT